MANNQTSKSVSYTVHVYNFFTKLHTNKMLITYLYLGVFLCGHTVSAHSQCTTTFLKSPKCKAS